MMKQASVKILLATLFCYVGPLGQSALADTNRETRINAPQAVEYRLSQGEKTPWEAMGLNLIPFGVGSFRQGDQVGGSMIAAIDGVVVLAMLSFAVKTAQARPGYASAVEIATIFFGLCLGRIIGFLAPWAYWTYTHPVSSEAQPHPNQFPESASLWNYQLNF